MTDVPGPFRRVNDTCVERRCAVLVQVNISGEATKSGTTEEGALQLVREILLSREPDVDQFPPVWRRYHHLAAHSKAWSRTGTIVLHYRF